MGYSTERQRPYRRVEWGQLLFDRGATHWLVEPFLVKGQTHAILADKCEGKSLFASWLAYRLATGRPALCSPAAEPMPVMYLDFNSSMADLRERAWSFGATPDELDRLAYYLQPDIPPLDTKEGGLALRALLGEHHPRLVVVDSFSHATHSPASSAVREFCAYSATELAQAGATTLLVDGAYGVMGRPQGARLDKRHDVDVVWRMSPVDGGFTLKADRVRGPSMKIGKFHGTVLEYLVARTGDRAISPSYK